MRSYHYILFWFDVAFLFSIKTQLLNPPRFIPLAICRKPIQFDGQGSLCWGEKVTGPIDWRCCKRFLSALAYSYGLDVSALSTFMLLRGLGVFALIS